MKSNTGRANLPYKSEFAEVTYYDDRIQAGCFRRRRTIGKYL